MAIVILFWEESFEDFCLFDLFNAKLPCLGRYWQGPKSQDMGKMMQYVTRETVSITASLLSELFCSKTWSAV